MNFTFNSHKFWRNDFIALLLLELSRYLAHFQ